MRLISRLEQESRLDAAVSAGQRVARLIRPGKVRDALHGVWLGHPVHPMLVQATTGAWLSASILDLTGAGEKAARRLVAAGIGAAVPAALAGAADWSEQHEQQMRVGVIHAAGNEIATAVSALFSPMAASPEPSTRGQTSLDQVMSKPVRHFAQASSAAPRRRGESCRCP